MESVQAKRERLERLRAQVRQLEEELEATPEHGYRQRWRATEFYTAYYATTGFLLGMLGAVTSLLFNVVGSLAIGQHPLRIIQVYLTFPLGERAFTSEMDSGMVLAIGCCLYIGTGMLLGMIFQLVLCRFAMNDSLGKRMLIATALSIVVWLVNFYGILSWLQPMLFGGNWIIEEIPWYVGLATHLVFGWTMALVFPLGLYHPYVLQTEKQ